MMLMEAGRSIAFEFHWFVVIAMREYRYIRWSVYP